MEQRITKLEKQMKKTIKELRETRKAFDEHLSRSDKHLGNIHTAFHDINQTLVSLKDPLITVTNGKEEQKPLSRVQAEMWEALALQRSMLKTQRFLKRHKVLRALLFVGVAFSFTGVIWTIVSVPVTDVVDWALKIAKHIL